MERIRVLLIEDNPGDARLIKEMLSEEKDISLEWKDNLQDGLKRLAEGGIDIVLLDLMMPDSIGGHYTFTKVQAQAPGIPIVVMTGFADESFAISLVRMGAQDYLIKGQTDRNLLARDIRYAIERKLANVFAQAFKYQTVHISDTQKEVVRAAVVQFFYKL